MTIATIRGLFTIPFPSDSTSYAYYATPEINPLEMSANASFSMYLGRRLPPSDLRSIPTHHDGGVSSRFAHPSTYPPAHNIIYAHVRARISNECCARHTPAVGKKKREETSMK